jgi:hypothetical protein
MEIMKSIKDFYFKKGQQMVPGYCLILPLLFLCLDFYTTYLASPDLKIEGNPVVRYFHWGWAEILFWNLLIIFVMLFLTVLSDRYILNYMTEDKRRKLKNKFVFFLSLLMIIYFYSYFFGEFFVNINNYFNYLGVYTKSDNLFYGIAVKYVDFYMKYTLSANLIATYTLCLLFGITSTIGRLIYVKKRAHQVVR